MLLRQQTNSNWFLTTLAAANLIYWALLINRAQATATVNKAEENTRNEEKVTAVWWAAKAKLQNSKAKSQT